MSDHAEQLCREIHDLVTARLTDAATPEQHARLDELTSSDPEARRLYAESVHEAAAIRWLLGDVNPFGEEQEPEETKASEAVVVETQSSPRPRFSMEARHLAVGIAVGVAFIVMSLSTMHQILMPLRVATKDKGDERKADRPRPVESIARLVNDIDAQWQGSVHNPLADRRQRISTGMRLYPGQKLKLVSGLAEFKFYNGAEVVLEGPAEIEVQGRKQCRLESGQLVALATEERSKGFIVETPTAHVEDLGTEFAVSVGRGGETDVYVFEGNVRLVSMVESHNEATIELAAEQGGRVSRGAMGVSRLDDPPPAAAFVRVGELRDRESEAYAQRVLAMKPDAYWRMEGLERLQVTDSMANGHHGQLHPGGEDYAPWSPGRIGSSLVLRGPTAGDGVAVPDNPQSTTGHMTMAAWVRAAGEQQWGIIAADWTRQSTTFHFATHVGGGDISAYITQRDGTHVIAREGASSPLPVGSWQHVAFVADGEELRLYRQGKQVDSIAYDGTIANSTNKGFGIGVKLLADGALDKSLYWHGSIDELVMFNRALSIDEIRQLAGQNE